MIYTILYNGLIINMER